MAQTPRSYLRFPHIHENLVTFVADDDVWLAELPAAGTAVRATRITSEHVPVQRPRFSPDGALIGWTGTQDGAEAYAVPTEGGTPTRLTYWGHPRTGLRGWLSPTEALVVGWGDHGHRAYMWAHAVPIDGAPARRLPYGVLQDVDPHGPGGAVVLSRGLSRDSSSWKHYRGGSAGKLWIDPEGSGEFHRLLADLDGNLGDPMWVGGRVAFHSDHDGVAELYSCLATGEDLRKHTDGADGYYLRHASTDGRRVVFERAGRLWLLDSLDPGAEPRLLDIRLLGATGHRVRQVVDPAKHLGVVAPDHTGRASAVEVRGTVHWLAHKDGPARVLYAADGVRATLPVVLGATGAAAWVTDEGDDYAIVVADVEGTEGGTAQRSILRGELPRVIELVASPDGRHLAVATVDNRLLVVDVENGTARTVASGDGAFNSFPTWGLHFTSEPAFSPDSRWLAWSQRSPVADAWQIRVADVETLTPLDVTTPRFRDWNPVFTLDGKHLAFLSARTFDTVQEDMVYDFSFASGVRPYLVPLAETEPSPFAPRLGGAPVDGAEAEAAAAKKDEASEGKAEHEEAHQAPKTVLDPEGLTQRVVPFPVPSGDYQNLKAAKGGLLWTSHVVAGSIGDAWSGSDQDAPRPALQRFDFAERELTTLVDGLDDYAVTGDGARVIVVDGGEITVRPSDKPEDKPQTVGLDRIRSTVDLVAERRQSMHETWRLQRELFHDPAMTGIDWPASLARYEPLIEAVASHDDFVDLLWELQGDLRTSHAYVDPPRPSRVEARKQGLLGADLTRGESGTWQVARILPTDTSFMAARSPLSAPGVAVRPGDVILAVDGRPVPAAHGPNALLAGKADQPVELTVSPGGTGEPRRVVVVPIGDEVPLRYQDWVADRRAHVHEASGGRLGYIHLPDHDAHGWAELHRDLRSQVVKDGLIVDTRGNRGGQTSGLVVERLTRKAIAWEQARGEIAEPYPAQSPRGPVVSVCDEYAGSDGDIVNQAFKVRGVPVVGVRTWGGVVGIDGRFDLVDGTVTTQPRYGFWFDGIGLGLENHGCEPTVEVPCPPQDYAAGRDPQLDAAIAIALAALEEHPPASGPA